MERRKNRLKLQHQSLTMTSSYVLEALKGFSMIKVGNSKMSCFITLIKSLNYLDCIPPPISLNDQWIR